MAEQELCCGRCIQRADQPIILTGYAALNKLLGREVYTSHMQLGGPKVGTSTIRSNIKFYGMHCLIALIRSPDRLLVLQGYIKQA